METFLWIAGVHLFELLGLGIYFIIRKNRKLEQAVAQQQEYIDTLNILFANLNSSFNSLDEKVWVEGDSELSEVFNNISEIKQAINQLYN
jgi:hypothetical protein